MSAVDPSRMLEALTMFDALAELAGSERNQQLDALQRDDPVLARMVVQLLDADAQAAGPLDRGLDHIAHTLLTELEAPFDPSRVALEAGMQLAAFTLLRPLGSGGMGEVWQAQRRDGSFVQEVALKLLKRGMDSDEIARRFMRERRILADLNHPHIARFIDGGVTDDARLYFAMEYVDGVPITDHASERELDIRARVRLMVAVCEAVAYAQSHLVVHRDLKPSNILIDRSGQPRVLDFGIAKLVGETVAETAVTSTGVRLLSPAYAAPEQVLDEPISTATDVYALGVVAFELLTGSLPHARSRNFAALAAQVREEIAIAPSMALKRQSQSSPATTLGSGQQRVARELAGDLDLVVLKALQRDPTRRYANAAALADDMQRWLDGRPVTAQADTTTYRMRRFVARNRLAVGSASAVLLALIAGFGVAVWQAGEARQQATLARAEAARAEQQTAIATAASERANRVKNFMMQTFVEADPLRRDDHAPVTVAEAFTDAIARVDSELSADPVLQIDVLDDFSEIRSNQGRFDEARVLVNRALELAEKTYPPMHPAIAESLQNRATIENYSGNDFAQASADLQRAVAILEADASADRSNLANALNGLAAIYLQSGKSDEALALLQRALELWRSHGETATEGLAATLHNSANALFTRGRIAEAVPLAEEALAEVVRLHGENSPQQEPILDLLAQMHYRRGELDVAATLQQRRLTLVTAAFSGPHPWTASVLTDMGQQVMKSDPDKAAELLDAAIAMFEQVDSIRILMPLRYRALLARSQSGAAEAKVWFDRALAECSTRSLEHLMCDVVRANRAGVIAALGDGTLALSEAEAAMASMRAKGDGDESEYAQALEAKALAQQALGERDQAIATQNEAVALYLSLFGEEHEEVARARRNLQKLQ